MLRHTRTCAIACITLHLYIIIAAVVCSWCCCGCRLIPVALSALCTPFDKNINTPKQKAAIVITHTHTHGSRTHASSGGSHINVRACVCVSACACVCDACEHPWWCNNRCWCGCCCCCCRYCCAYLILLIFRSNRYCHRNHNALHQTRDG